jgi:hydrogenase expression/formation protein HypE
MAEENIITLLHGAGGAYTRKLQRNIVLRYLNNPELEKMGDSALISLQGKKIAFTTDNFVINPIFFPGGDVGRVAITGTVNDLAVSGAQAHFISAGFILEEGFAIADFEKILDSMAKASFECGVKVVCSDIKVVEKGKGDGIFINTAGIGIVEETSSLSSAPIREGDRILLSGAIGEHELTILLARHKFNFKVDIKSDCAPLNALTRTLLNQIRGVKAMRDLTQGGLTGALCKWVEFNPFGIKITKKTLPIRENVRNFARLLGLNPLYLANQGKLALICSADDAEKALKLMRKNPLGAESAIIGEVCENIPGRVILVTENEGEKILEMSSGEGSVRVC